MQEKIFKADMSKFYAFALLAIAVALMLVWQGYHYLHFFWKSLDPISIVFSCFLPILFGLIIIFVVVLIFLANASKTIKITPADITYSRGHKTFNTTWKNLIFASTPPEKKNFRQITISDGKNFGKIDEFFFPQYDFIIEIIRKAKSIQKDETFNV